MPFPFELGKPISQQSHELLVGKRAVNLRRDPLQRVRDNGVPMGRLRGGAMRHAIVALSTRQSFAPRACLPTTNSYIQLMGYPRKVATNRFGLSTRSMASIGPRASTSAACIAAVATPSPARTATPMAARRSIPTSFMPLPKAITLAGPSCCCFWRRIRAR